MQISPIVGMFNGKKVKEIENIVEPAGSMLDRRQTKQKPEKEEHTWTNRIE